MTTPSERRRPRPAPADLLVLQRAEDLAAFVLQRSARWPKSHRHSLTQRLEAHLLDVVEALVVARYQRDGRADRLATVNLQLERARFVLRLLAVAHVCPANHYEGTARRIDEVGRLLHGWRTQLAGRSA